MMLMIASHAAGRFAFAGTPDQLDSGRRAASAWTCASGTPMDAAADTGADRQYLLTPSFLRSLHHWQDCDDSRAHWFHRFAQDQLLLWTYPARLQATDVQWLLPFSLIAAGTLATDTEFSKHLSSSPSRLKYSSRVSNYGVGAISGLAGGLFLWGELTGDDHSRETGFLAGAAALNSFALAYTLKYAFGRARPLQNDYQGKFRAGGDSFPSEHAAAAWSIAGVIAHEYPGNLTRLLIYEIGRASCRERV